ncbi:hypothetical protein [Pseudomonas syringae]|uniref:Uncharacterized protein n=1 Tax=Pseudomonas syringae pv. actinidiae TaxID=103796 RepID=A0A2V0QY52_PSESF|nr:hypothetical protein [Pseudomonas syringae]GBH13570.1 hypothetical protein KPSA1_07060 [Pseudomonas syringae pv. actinidiae]
MSWTDITDNGRVYSMAHLQPFTHVYKIDERDITVHFTFGFHCFTDEKDDGKLISNRGDRRSFSPSRWEASKELGPWIRNGVRGAMEQPTDLRSRRTLLSSR